MPDVNPADYGATPIGPRPEDYGAVPIGRSEPDLASANGTLARTIGNAMQPAFKTGKEMALDMATVYAPIEAFLNIGSGLLTGFPAKVGASISGLAQKYGLGMDVDPKELADTISGAVTYVPKSDAGLRLTGNIMLPIEKLAEVAKPAGQFIARHGGDIGLSTGASAYAGAFTEEAINFLPGILLGALYRRMGGGIPSNEDFTNTAKVMAAEKGPVTEDALRASAGAKPTAATEPSLTASTAKVKAIEDNLRTTYEKTGIDPFTISQAAEGDVVMQQQLAKEGGGVPESILAKLTTEKPLGGTTGDGGTEAPAESKGVGKPVSVSDIHALADERGIPWDDDPAFMAMTKEVTGKERLDDLTPEERQAVFNRMGGPLPEPAKPLLDVSGETAGEARAGEKGIAELGGKLVAGVPEGVTDVNMGINPAAAAKAYAESYTPYVGLGKPFKGAPAGGMLDSLYKVIAPAARGPIASKQAGIMRANFGEMAHERELALENMKGFAADFDKRPVQQSYDFIDAMEAGKKLGNAKLQEAADGIRALLDAKREEVQALGKGQLENFIENYFPHIWKDETAAQSFFGRRPLTGSGAFLKQRTFDTFKEGLDAGLKPITTNPVELALLKAREMDKYIYGQKIFEEMKSADLAKFVGFGDKAPVGWTKINDKIARVLQKNEGDGGGMILRGEYYAPDEAATLINNHLSPGLQGGTLFDAWRGIGMAMNSAQLGLSLFHVGFTTLDSMVSRVALGVKQAARGDILEGAGNVVAGIVPTQSFVNIYKGDRLLRAYLGKLSDPELSPIVDAIMEAGGRVKMDDFYRNATVNGFKNAIRTNDWGGAAKAFLPTVLDRVSAPIFEELVPRQKLGVYFDMAKDWLENNKDARPELRRQELGKLWDSVDNRMGQLVYDNVFWNRTLKDGLMATVRSVGWNLGTFRELGGGVKDLVKTGLGDPLSDRTAYVVALPLVTAIYGALTGYLYTGEAPQELKDYFFPKTGRLRPDGSADRVSLPTYMKDVYAYGEDVTNFAKYGSDPLQTIENKAHPLISTVAQMLNNEDFYGATIRNPSAPAVTQIKEEVEYLFKQIEPFSLRNYQQQAKLKGEEATVGGYLTTPSMIGVAPAPGYITKSDEQKESGQVSKLRDGLIKKFRQDIKDGADADALVPDMLKAGLTRNDIRYILRTSGDEQRPRRLKKFGD